MPGLDLSVLVGEENGVTLGVRVATDGVDGREDREDIGEDKGSECKGMEGDEGEETMASEATGE